MGLHRVLASSGPAHHHTSHALCPAFSPFPDGFAVQSVWVKDEVCYVNVSSVMLRSLPPEISTVLPTQTLRSSLLSLENVREVRFLVDGEEVINLDSVRELSAVEVSGV